MAYQKIGFHAGGGGNLTGIGDYFQRLDAAGLPATLVAADGYGPAGELAALARASGVPHTILFRWTALSTANYNATPEAAADSMWAAHRERLAETPEFDKESVWLGILNEPDKNRADWLGNFGTEIAQRANADGYRVALFGWSSGEPEYGDWETPGMLRYLRYCEAHPDMAAVNLHEYSYDVTDIRSWRPYLIGRFQFLFDVCDEHGIARPRAIIGEWGWEYENVPAPDQALEDIVWAADIYAAHDEILGAGLWYLGAGYKDIADRVQRLIAPVRDFSLESQWAPPADEPEPLPEERMDQVTMVFVSHNQGNMDWQRAKDAGADAALIRLTMGEDGIDNRAFENFAGAAQVEIPRQPIAYLRLNEDPDRWWHQIRHFADQLWRIKPRPELPPALMIETPNPNPEELVIRVAYSMALLEASWRFSGPAEMYTAAWWMEEWIPNPIWKTDRWPLHVADYRDGDPELPSGYDHWLWHQYDCEAPGSDWGASSTHICLSRYNGTLADFELAYGLREPEPTPEPQTGVLNRDFNLRRWPELGAASLMLTADAGTPVTVTQEIEGDEYDGSTRWYELAVVAHSSGVDLDGDPEPEPEPPPIGGVTFPVGTAEERAAAVDGWPGAWIDANPYGNYYHVRDGRYAYHTGADLNLNRPAWDSDRGKPVVAVAAGVVTYAGRFNSSWGNIIVVRHDGFYSRASAIDGLLVAAGDEVAAGQQVAVVGRHKVGEPFHLHFDISLTERLAENPGDWPGTDRARLERDYVPPLQFVLERLGEAPATGQGQGPARLGLHASADSGDLRPEEIGMFGIVRPGVVKVLSSHANGVAELARNHPDATFIVRAFLDFGGRNVTPAQFVDWTRGDVERAIANIGDPGRIWVELHNEPNLRDEGWQSSWGTPEEFSDWLLDVRSRFAAALPSAVRYIYPGLSPGGSITNIRYDWLDWLERSRPAVNACDAFGVHAYWNNQNYPMAQALGVVDEAIRRFPGKTIWLTEASNNKEGDPAEKGRQYVEFWTELRRRPAVEGVTYFVASASNEAFADEVWMVAGRGRGTAEVVGNR